LDEFADGALAAFPAPNISNPWYETLTPGAGDRFGRDLENYARLYSLPRSGSWLVVTIWDIDMGMLSVWSPVCLPGLGLRRHGLVLLALLAVWPAAAGAQVADEQKFQDWLLRCETDPADATVKRCFIAQGVASGEERRRVMMLAVAYPPDRKAPIFTAVLPLGVDLRSGIELAIDGGAPKRLPFTICLADGCRAHVPLDDALLAAFKRGLEGSVAFRRPTDGRAVKVPFSLKGFTAAVGALP
jgi:invasion protein IalB